jgi:hypothetical protein
MLYQKVYLPTMTPVSQPAEMTAEQARRANEQYGNDDCQFVPAENIPPYHPRFDPPVPTIPSSADQADYTGK